MNGRGTRFVFGLLTISLSLIVTLLLAEVGVRLFLPRGYWSFRDATDDWQTDSQLGWVQKPNFELTTHNGEFHWTTEFHTNPDGLLPSTAVRSKAPGVVRVMLFGDSAVAGRAVPEDQRLHAQLQRVLRARGINAEVINAGVEGYSTDQELLLVKRLVPLYRPDVVLNAICENDFDANVSDMAYGISKPLFHTDGDRITGWTPPDPKRLEIKKSQSAGLASLIQYSALYRFFQPEIYKLRSRIPFLRNDNLVVALPSDFYYNAEALKKVNFHVFEVLMREMRSSVEAEGATFWFYSHPHINEVWDPYIASTEKRLGLQAGVYDRYALDRKLKEISSRNAMRFCPVVDYFIQNQSRGPFHLLPRDPHCNPRGYQLQSEVLTQCLTHAPGADVTALSTTPAVNSR